MEKFRSEFEEVIRRAQSGNYLDEAAKLALLGRLEYAGERGDITLNEMEALAELMEPGIRGRYNRALDIAAFGSPESAQALAS